MNLLNLFNKKANPKDDKKLILLAMPMFNNNSRYQIDNVIDNLKSFWGFEISNFGGDNEAAVFEIDGESVAIAYVDLQIPWGDIEGTAQYAYNWPKALIELQTHTGHAIVSIMAGQKSSLERYWILSKILYTILITSEAIGVYQGAESLLISRDKYISTIDKLGEGDIPVMLWIYIGLRKNANGNSSYTYGLKNFQKQEIEIIDSKLSLEEQYNFLANIIHYIIGNDVTLKNGETIGNTTDQKIAINTSKGRFVEGESLKFKM